MGDISKEALRSEINAILKTADLTVVSAKKVREQVEKKLKCSLVNRKKEFDEIVMDFINQQNEEDGSSEEEEEEPEASASEEEPSSEEETKKKTSAKKRPQPTQRKAAPKKKKRKSINASESGSDSDGSDSDYEVPKKVGAKKKARGGSGGGGAGGGTVRKSTGFTRAYNLSPELSALMGAESLPRHEVVKKVWAIIKERNLYDPKNKQFAICDDELMKVMKVKRFRTFGMLKHLKPHFLD